MIIKNYSCDRFAGIVNKNISFMDGLNVIVGDNESGKSTVVEGIYSVLFKSGKFDSRLAKHKEFTSKFMPITKGDSIDGELTVITPEGNYKLNREWGVSSSSKLVTPESEILKDEDNIAEVLKDILVFGEGTYSNIFFSKQKHIKQAIEKIIKNPEATGEVSSLLRKAVMELDGVSLDSLGQIINRERENLTQKWLLDRGSPQNNRGVNNPYVNGVGEILDAFYKKENIRLDMERADTAEKQLETIWAEMKAIQISIEQAKAKIAAMEKISDDVTSREILEPKLTQFEKDLATLTKINREWPESNVKLDVLRKELAKFEKRYEALETEKELVKKAEAKSNLVGRIEKIDSLQNSISECKKKISAIAKVTSQDIDALEQSNNGMLVTKVAMEAGTMYGKVNKLTAGTDMNVAKDLDEPIQLAAGESFNANGFIRLEIDNKIEIEIKSGEADFAELRNKYAEDKKKLDSGLVALKVDSIENAKLNFARLNELSRESKTYVEKIEEILNGESYEDIATKIKEFGDLGHVKSLETIETEMKEVNSRLIEVKTEKNTIENSIREWCEEYTDVDGLLNKIVEIKTEQKAETNKLEKLAPLPEEYATAREFRNDLMATRQNHEVSNSTLIGLKDKMNEAENNMPESSYEELKNEFDEEESRFNAKLRKTEKILKIQKAYEDTRASMDSSSFDPVIKAFSKNLAKLTTGNYSDCDIDDNFNINIKKDAQTVMPLDLLSSGTHDSVALALRLAISENILEGIKGFLVLDDCLVDLDPTRKAMAAELIKKFAENHQVIFTTCSPNTAELLGGNVVQM